MICAVLFLLLGVTQQDAETMLRAAVAQAESAQPVNLRRVDDAVLDLAQFLQARGRSRESEPLYLRSHEIARTQFGSTSYAAALSLLRLSSVYHAEQRFDRAEEAAREATALFLTFAGEESLEYASAIANLGAVLADQAQMARAEPVLRRALYLIRKQVKGNPAFVACIEENLGLVYLRQGEFRKAEALLRGALATFESTNDAGQASALAGLAELAIAEHRWVEAEGYIGRAYEQTPGGRDGLVGILHLRALIEAHAGDQRQAIVDMKRSVDLLEQLSGPESSTLAILLGDYARILRHAGQKREARAVERRIKSTVTKITVR